MFKEQNAKNRIVKSAFFNEISLGKKSGKTPIGLHREGGKSNLSDRGPKFNTWFEHNYVHFYAPIHTYTSEAFKKRCNKLENYQTFIDARIHTRSL